MRVVFAGTPEVALPSLDAIAASGHELVGVVTRPDAPSGRGRKLVASPVGAARRGARRTRPQARPPARPRVPGRAAATLRARLLPGRRVRRAAAAVRARHPRARLGQPALLAAARLARRGARCSTRSGPATRSPAPPRSGSSRSSTPGPTYGVMTERIRPTDTAGDLLGRLAEGGAGLLVAHPRRHRRRLARGPRAARRRRQPRAQDPRRATPAIDWTEPAVARRPPDPRLHARRPAPGRPATGERIKLGAGHRRRPAASARARACSRSPRTPSSSAPRTDAGRGSARSRRSARSRCAPPTGPAA